MTDLIGIKGLYKHTGRQTGAGGLEQFAHSYDTHNVVVYKLETPAWEDLGSPEMLLITTELVPDDYGE